MLGAARWLVTRLAERRAIGAAASPDHEPVPYALEVPTSFRDQPIVPAPAPLPEERLTILASKNVTRGKAAAAAVHAALEYYGIDHGAVIVLSEPPSRISAQCDIVIRDAGRTEVEPGTITAGIRRPTEETP